MVQAADDMPTASPAYLAERLLGWTRNLAAI
jgi:hypothetical protein